ncbi:SAM-dependent methyltransferase [Alteromonas facilis]|uniref:SAM-dependent methyltransferase n=1 Tax=Alteromonas facilis TaxID=2048004 RepID=UPI000C28B65F|nr:SAM-dependent methyltransferase [Alteromonas facilis]
MSNNQLKKGSITCVGTGMTIGAHMSIRCKNHISQADVVFSSCHPVMQQHIERLNPNTHSLQYLYSSDKPRNQTYIDMVEVMMDEVRQGKRVVGAFYGHPGVFARAPHNVIRQAREEGYSAVMEPGISAEDCLYADVGIDPGDVGCQHYEASQFMFYQHRYDASAYLVLWQIALAGELSLTTKVSSSQHVTILCELLYEHYAPSHQVILYECPTLPTDDARIDYISLADLPTADMSPITTLIVPPAYKPIQNAKVLQKLRLLTSN